MTAQAPLTGEVKLDLSGVSDDPICSYEQGAGELCIRDLNRAYARALDALVHEFIRGGAGPRYRAVFRVLELSHFPVKLAQPGQKVPSYVDLRWQFVLIDNRDNDIFVLTRQTRAPELLRGDTDREAFVRALLDKTLAELGSALNEADLHVPNEQRVFSAPK